jgi:hypothetical protein
MFLRNDINKTVTEKQNSTSDKSVIVIQIPTDLNNSPYYSKSLLISLINSSVEKGLVRTPAAPNCLAILR